MLRWFNRAGTVLLVLLVVVVPPAVAFVWAAEQGWRRPTGAQVLGWLQDPPAEAFPVVLVGALGTGLWLLIAVLVARTMTGHAVRGWRRLRRMPLPTPAQATAGSLAGTALLGIPAITHTLGPPEPAPPAGTGQQDTDTADSHQGMPASDPPAEAAHGIALPDGSWIPADTAQQIAAMTGLLWLRRRQTYQPTPGGTPTTHPPPDLPTTAAAVTARAAAAGVVTELVSADQLPAGHITLTGAGAYAAARGLLITALMTPAPTPVLITHRDWRALLGDTASGLPVPGLHVSDDNATALRNLPQLTHAGSASAGEATVLHLCREHLGRSLVAADEPRLTTVAFDAARTPGKLDWLVDADGNLTADGAPRRLCVLGQQAAIDLLTLIALTHQPRQPAAASQALPHTQPPRTAQDPSHGSATAVPAARPARLTVLGTCRLTVDGAAVPIRRSAAWQILILLATRPDGATSRDLVEAAWPGLHPASISRRLHTTLSDLRSQLKPLLDLDLITRRADRYTLDTSIIDVDLWHLHAAARTAARTIATEPRHQAQRAVIDAYTRELAAGHTWHWLAEPRDTIRRAVIDAYVDLATDQPAAQAVALLTDAIDVDPYNEHVHRLAVRALTATGDHTAATRLQQAHTRRLVQAGLHPSPD